MAREHYRKVWKTSYSKDYMKCRKYQIWRRLKKIFPNQKRNDFNRIHKHYGLVTVHFD